MLDPEKDLKRKLDLASARLRRLEGRALSLRLLPYYLILLALILLLDLWFHFSSGIRLGLLISLLLIGFITFIKMLWHGYGRPMNQRRVARHLESVEPALGSNLINFLDLQDTAKNSALPEQTKTFAKQAIQSNASAATRHPLESLPHVPRLRRAAKIFGYACLITLLLSIIAWPIVKAHVPRFLDPYGNHPPFSLTNLAFASSSETNQPIIYGNELRIKVEVKGHHPDRVDLLYWPTERPDEIFRSAMLERGESEFLQRITEIKEPITLLAQTPDGRSRTEEMKIDVIMIPQLEAIEIQIIPPTYTNLPSTKRAYQFNEIRALAGSTIRLTANSNRPLFMGRLELQRPLEEDFAKSIDMLPVDDSSVMGEIIVDETIGFRVTIMDEEGLASEPSPNGSIYMLSDRKPSVSVTQPDRSSFLSLDASVAVKIEAYDDYGLSELRIHRAVNGIFSKPKTMQLTTNSERSVSHEWQVDFKDLGVQAEDVISVFAEVIDNSPTPQIARSEMIRIAAISVEDYNSLLRQEADLTRIAKKYEALQEQFGRIQQEQAAIQKELDALMEELSHTEDPAQREKLMQEFASLRQRQDAVNDEMDQLAQQLTEAIRENPLYDVESTFREQFNEDALQLYQAAATNRAAMQKLEAAMQANPDMSLEQQMAAMEQFAQGLQAQRDAFDQQANDTESASETMQDMALFHEMVKNFNRFASLANQQQSLADQAAAFDQSSKLSREDQLALRDLALRQKEIADELEFLTQKFRSDAEKGADTFPKSAASSQEFADAIEAARSTSLGRSATQSMLNGNGNNSASLSQSMSDSMNALIGQCNGGMGAMSNELDRALSATRPGAGSKTFQQMLENLQMRYQGMSGMGSITGSGQGNGTAQGGFSTQSPNAPALYGNESLAAEGNQSEQSSSEGGSGAGDSDANNNSGTLAAPGSLDGLQEEQRRAGSTTAESLFIEHNTLIDAYFKKITEVNK